LRDAHKIINVNSAEIELNNFYKTIEAEETPKELRQITPQNYAKIYAHRSFKIINVIAQDLTNFIFFSKLSFLKCAIIISYGRIF
jgi:hypothetical protein